MDDLKLPFLICKRCGHKWIPRSVNYPHVCARCNSPYWNKERHKMVGPKKKKKKDDRDLGELTELAHDVN